MAGLYGHNLSIGSLPANEILIRILRLQEILREWKRALPTTLSLLSSTAMSEVNIQDPIAEKYRFILTLRYMNAQLLLYRPVLVILLQERTATASSPTNSGLQQSLTDQLQENLMECCLQSAQSIITLIHDVLSRDDLGRKFLGAWWFTIYYCTLQKSPALLANQ